MKEKTVSAYCNDILGNLDGVKIAELISLGEIEATEVIEAAIARAESVNPRLNAIVTETFQQSREQAKKKVTAPFGGVPSFIKDTEDVEGISTSFGSTFKTYLSSSSIFVLKLFCVFFDIRSIVETIQTFSDIHCSENFCCAD